MKSAAQTTDLEVHELPTLTISAESLENQDRPVECTAGCGEKAWMSPTGGRCSGCRYSEIAPEEPALTAAPQCEHELAERHDVHTGLFHCPRCSAWLDLNLESVSEPHSLAMINNEPAIPHYIPTMVSVPQPSKKGQAEVAIHRIDRLDMIEEENIEYLWVDRIPIGKLSVLFGKKGSGKSFVSHSLAALVSRGAPMPGEHETTKHEPHDVLILSFEDGAGDTLRPRIARLGGDLQRIHVHCGSKINDQDASFTAADLPVIAGMIEMHPAIRLVIIDPIMSVLAGVKTNSDADVRAVLDTLKKMAERFRVPIVINAHSRKPKRINDPLDELEGSVAFANLARSVLHVGRDPNDPELRIITKAAGNLTGSVPGFAFRIAADEEDEKIANFTWEGERDISTIDVMNSGAGESNKIKKPTKATQAKVFIRDALLNGPLLATTIQSDWEKSGGSLRTLQRASEAISELTKGPRKGEQSGVSYWTLVT